MRDFLLSYARPIPVGIMQCMAGKCIYAGIFTHFGLVPPFYIIFILDFFYPILNVKQASNRYFALPIKIKLLIDWLVTLISVTLIYFLVPELIPYYTFYPVLAGFVFIAFSAIVGPFLCGTVYGMVSHFRYRNLEHKSAWRQREKKELESKQVEFDKQLERAEDRYINPLKSFIKGYFNKVVDRFVAFESDNWINIFLKLVFAPFMDAYVIPVSVLVIIAMVLTVIAGNANFSLLQYFREWPAWGQMGFILVYLGLIKWCINHHRSNIYSLELSEKNKNLLIEYYQSTPKWINRLFTGLSIVLSSVTLYLLVPYATMEFDFLGLGTFLAGLFIIMNSEWLFKLYFFIRLRFHPEYIVKYHWPAPTNVNLGKPS